MKRRLIKRKGMYYYGGFCDFTLRLFDGFYDREYVEALEREMISRNNQAAVQQLLQEARNEVSVHS
jgi:hypothetical protein